MQEDVYYSKYLEHQYSTKTLSPKRPDVEAQIKTITKNILDQLGPGQEQRREPIERILKDSQVEQIAMRLGGSRSLSELYLRPKLWPKLAEKYQDDELFLEEVSRLTGDGLVTMVKEDYLTCKLSDMGTPPFLNSCLKSWIELHYMVW